MEKELINTGNAWEKDFPFSPDRKLPWTQIAKVRGGALLFIAGQTAWDDLGRVIRHDDMEAQTEQVYKNVRDALTAGGAKLSDIVCERVYVTNMEEFMRIGNATRGKFFADAGVTTLPPMTLIGVKRLATKDFMLEVEVIAAIE